jgi:hypothetical protein
MRGENKMIDAVFVYDAIGKVTSRFKKSQLHTARHYYEVECEDGEPYEVHFYIEDEIKTIHSFDKLFHYSKSPENIIIELSFRSCVYIIYHSSLKINNLIKNF